MVSRKCPEAAARLTSTAQLSQVILADMIADVAFIYAPRAIELILAAGAYVRSKKALETADETADRRDKADEEARS